MKQADKHQNHNVQEMHAVLDLQSTPLRIVVTGDDPVSISIRVVTVPVPRASTQDLRESGKTPRLAFLPPDHPSITALSLHDSDSGCVTSAESMKGARIVAVSAPNAPVPARRNPPIIRRWRFAVVALSVGFLLTLITLAMLSHNLVVLAVIWTSILAHPKIHAS